MRTPEEIADRLVIYPCELAEANTFVLTHHRHHGPVVGHKFSLSACLGERVCGVAIVGRPVLECSTTGLTLEVLRVAADGTRNACSCLYGACRRATLALGYRRLVTYVLSEEPGTSLAAAGWKCIGVAGGGSWSRADRPRVDRHPTQRKIRWEAT